MPIYRVRCEAGHEDEVLTPYAAPLPACGCGAGRVKLPASFGVTGRAGVPPAPESMPQTWRGTYRGDRSYVTELRRQAEARRTFEERNPEHGGDRRPVLAHEGRYEHAPLRKGDPV